jgi:hypothetical protein
MTPRGQLWSYKVRYRLDSVVYCSQEQCKSKVGKFATQKKEIS